jgi:SEC-C motif
LVPGFDLRLAIFSSQLNVRPAWEIGENDPDVIGIHDDDNVVIPDHVKEAPVLRTLERIKRRRKQLPSQELVISPLQSQTKIGRNDPCPCGSGKKFKKCHGR